MSDALTTRLGTAASEGTLDLVAQICERHQISALDDFLASCRAFASDEILNVAILGRFKAGKSSFVNYLLGRPLLPVGAIPVTTAVTEIEYSPFDRAEVVFKNRDREQISLESIGDFISEARNPENQKQVVRVRLQLSSMAQYRGIRFVDTPGLDSVLEHNTEASLDWLPNVGLALVAVGVDPPLSQHDVELIKTLGRYTPNTSILLTKIDLLNVEERSQVEDFVQKQLSRSCNRPVSVFPFSTRPGLEHLRARIDRELLSGVRAEAAGHHAVILRHKIDSLAAECAEYLMLALKAAERSESEREQLRQSIIGQREYLDDSRQALRLVARHASGAARAAFERILNPHELPVRYRLLAELEREFSAWSTLSVASHRFEDWLAIAIAKEMGILSVKHRSEFVAPIRRLSRQLSQLLQDFRNRLSDRALSALGVPLRTTETELHVPDPASPDVRVGPIFDRNWELVSFLLPMWLIGGLVKRHFQRNVARVVFINLSRLATQWEDIVNESISTLEKEAVRRLDGLVSTIDNLIASAEQQTPRIRADLSQLEQMRNALSPADS